MKRHNRYFTLTTLLGTLMVVGALVAGEREWIKADTAAIIVSIGGYAIAQRRTKARELDLQQIIADALFRLRGGSLDPPDPPRPSAFGPRRKH